MVENNPTNARSMAACLAGCWNGTTFTQAEQFLTTSPDAGRFLAMASYVLDHIPYLRRAELNAMLDTEIGTPVRWAGWIDGP